MKLVLTLLPLLALLALTAAIYSGFQEDPGLPPLEVIRPAERAFAPIRRDLRDPLEGRVLDAQGEGLADALVYLNVEGVPIWTTTEEDGSFTLVDAGPTPLTISVAIHDHIPQDFDVTSSPAELRLKEAIAPPPRLEDVERRDLAGRVETDGSSTAAAGGSGYEVFLMPALAPDEFGGGVPRRALIDAQGAFELPELALGEYRVSILPGWARGSRWPDVVTRSQSVFRHEAGPGAARLELALASGLVRGRVTDPEGVPIEGALVSIVPLSDESRLWPPTVTDEAGTFVVTDLAPDGYRVSARAGVEKVDQEVSVTAGEATTVELEVPAVESRAESRAGG